MRVASVGVWRYGVARAALRGACVAVRVRVALARCAARAHGVMRARAWQRAQLTAAYYHRRAWRAVMYILDASCVTRGARMRGKTFLAARRAWRMWRAPRDGVCVTRVSAVVQTVSTWHNAQNKRKISR